MFFMMSHVWKELRLLHIISISSMALGLLLVQVGVKLEVVLLIVVKKVSRAAHSSASLCMIMSPAAQKTGARRAG